MIKKIEPLGKLTKLSDDDIVFVHRPKKSSGQSKIHYAKCSYLVRYSREHTKSQHINSIWYSVDNESEIYEKAQFAEWCKLCRPTKSSS